jgi:MFS family permease
MRALAIAVFYAVGTGVGGMVAPVLLGLLIQTGSRLAVAAGWGIGAIMMLLAGALALAFGVDAERKSLEDVAGPMALRSHDNGA